MKLRYSLRSLLILATTAIAVAAFWAVRSQPARIAAWLPDAIARSNPEAAALVQRADIPTTLGIKPSESWKIQSLVFQPQSFREWLSGQCLGKLVVSSHGSSDAGDVVWSAIQEFDCDVALSSSGLRVLAVAKGEPAVAGIPKPPYEN